MQVVDEAARKEVADGGDTSADAHILAVRCLAGCLERLGRRSVDDWNVASPSISIDGRVMREDEDRRMEGPVGGLVGGPTSPTSPGPRAIQGKVGTPPLSHPIYGARLREIAHGGGPTDDGRPISRSQLFCNVRGGPRQVCGLRVLGRVNDGTACSRGEECLAANRAAAHATRRGGLPHPGTACDLTTTARVQSDRHSCRSAR